MNKIKRCRGLWVAICSFTFAMSACSDDGESGPASSKVQEIEIANEFFGETSIERMVADYDGNKLKSVTYKLNGEERGRQEFIYEGSQIVDVKLFDAEGDQASWSWSYDAGQMVERTIDIPERYLEKETIDYEAGLPREISTVNTPVNGTAASNLYTRFEYNEGRLAEATKIEGQDNAAVTEFRYDENGQLDRLLEYDQGRLRLSMDYSYRDNKVFSAEDGDNNRYDVKYDENGRIAEIRYLMASGRKRTTEYTYAKGSIAGITIAPDMPGIFDLHGASMDKMYFDHFAPVVPEDFPTRVIEGEGSGSGADSGGSGSEGSGSGADSGGSGSNGAGGGQACSQTPQNNCDACYLVSCCSEFNACTSNRECIDYFQCVQGCSDSNCQTACAGDYPTGASLFGQFDTCVQSSCSSVCQ